MDVLNHAIPVLYDGMDIGYKKGQDVSTICEVVMPIFRPERSGSATAVAVDLPRI